MTIAFISLFVLLALSAFFSGTEAAYNALNVLRLKRKVKKPATTACQYKRLSLSLKIKRNFTYYITSILLCNNAVNLILSNVLTIIVIQTLGARYSFVSTIISSSLLIVFGEILPKLIGAKKSEKWAIRSSYAILILSIIFFPISFPLYKLIKSTRKKDGDSTITQKELEAAVEKIKDDGIIDNSKEELLQNAITFDEKCAYEICTPRIDIIGIDIEDDTEEWLNTIISSQYSRLPIYSDSPDNPKGTVYVPDYLKYLIENPSDSNEQKKQALLKMVKPPVFVHHTMKADDVYKLMNKQKNHFAFVSDEWGGTYGIITMDDALEELVGQINDEDDNFDDPIEITDDGTFVVSGSVLLKDLFDSLNISYNEDEYESVTIGGLAVEILNAFPESGDTFCVNGVNFKITEVERRRVKKLSGSVVGGNSLFED